MESPVIWQVLDEAYLQMGDNFLLGIRENAPQGLRSMYLVFLDETSAARMDAVFGVPTVTANGAKSKGLLLDTGVRMISCLLQREHDFLVVDNDACWLTDPPFPE